MNISRCRLDVAVAFAFMITCGWGCSSGSGGANPVGPSKGAVATVADAPPADVNATSHDPTLPPDDSPQGQSGPMDVTFPPRNEPLLFRTALEAKYRDGLRRSAVQTFVDQEGTVVWTQEYLRYRVNLCSHVDAVGRVFRQIDGQGIPAVCGTTSTVIFPPRNEPLDFMVQLEAKYRDSLRRASGPSFVDVEGNVVWTQEYLRYRVSGCAHSEAQQKVFDQIDGRGVQSDCAPGTSTGTFTGTWRGTVRSTGCTSTGAFASLCGSTPSIVDTMTLILRQSGSAVTGSIDVGGLPATATGTATGNRLSLSGRNVSGSITTSYESWDTSLSGSSMVGGFTIGLSGSGVSGFVRYPMTLSSVSKTARVPDTTSVTANAQQSGLSSATASAHSLVRER